MKSYTITSKQISAIHNAYCFASYAYDKLKDLLQEDSQPVLDLERALKELEPVRDDLMGRKDKDLDESYNYFKAIQAKEKFNSVWSLYEVEDIDQESGIPVGSILKSYYTKLEVQVRGKAWIDAWMAADILIKAADDSHVFIEGFHKHKDGTYELVLGS